MKFSYILISSLFIISCNENRVPDYVGKLPINRKLNTTVKHWTLLNNINDSILKFQETTNFSDFTDSKWSLTTNNSHYSNFSYNYPPSCGNDLIYIDSVSWLNNNDTIDLFLTYGQFGNNEIYKLNKKFEKNNLSNKEFELIQIENLKED